MFPLTQTVKILGFLPVAALLCSCQVSNQWAPSAFLAPSTNQNLPRPASFIPVSHPVPAPQQASIAALGGSWGSQPQTTATAVRETRPTWQQPVVASYNPPAQITLPIVQTPTPAPQQTPVTRGKVRLVNGRAIAPSDAPAVVKRAVAAGNRLQKMPYKWGGGHAKLNDNGYDCSGTVSYVLREAGLMKDQMTSQGFFNYGESGNGDWITVWVKNGHVFMDIGGLRLDTGGSTRRTGPRWKTKKRSYKGFVARHPRGL